MTSHINNYTHTHTITQTHTVFLLLRHFSTAAAAARTLDRACVALEALLGAHTELNFRRADYKKEPLVARVRGARSRSMRVCVSACLCFWFGWRGVPVVMWTREPGRERGGRRSARRGELACEARGAVGGTKTPMHHCQATAALYFTLVSVSMPPPPLLLLHHCRPQPGVCHRAAAPQAVRGAECRSAAAGRRSSSTSSSSSTGSSRDPCRAHHPR